MTLILVQCRALLKQRTSSIEEKKSQSRILRFDFGVSTTGSRVEGTRDCRRRRAPHAQANDPDLVNDDDDHFYIPSIPMFRLAAANRRSDAAPLLAAAAASASGK